MREASDVVHRVERSRFPRAPTKVLVTLDALRVKRAQAALAKKESAPPEEEEEEEEDDEVCRRKSCFYFYGLMVPWCPLAVQSLYVRVLYVLPQCDVDGFV